MKTLTQRNVLLASLSRYIRIILACSMVNLLMIASFAAGKDRMAVIAINNRDTLPPMIYNTWNMDSTLNRIGPYQIRTQVMDYDGIANVKLIYSLDETMQFDTINMLYNAPQEFWWEFIHPSDTLEPGTVILYRIMASDSIGNISFDPPFGFFDLVILDWIIDIDFIRNVPGLCQFDYERDYWDDGDSTTDDKSDSWCAPTATARS